MPRHTDRGSARSLPGGSLCQTRAVFAFSQSRHVVFFFLNLIYKGKRKHYFLRGRLGSLWGLQSLGRTDTWLQCP